jgi:uncharacterized SAM-binding protein YcdF (DUF218 family)
MFFFISKIFAFFCEPLTYVFLFLLVALIFYRKPRLGKTCILLALLVFMVFGTKPVPDMLIRFLESQYQPVSPLPHVDAVIVLSGALNLRLSTPQHLEFGEGVERILAGIKLVQEGYGDVLIISGGSGDIYDQTKREAVFLRQFAIDLGVPEKKILIDQNSRNTYENATNTRAIMEQHGISSSILVTTASHLPRSMACFEKLGIKPIPYPVDFYSAPDPDYNLFDIIPGVSSLKRTSFILHEYIGILIYKLVGYI